MQNYNPSRPTESKILRMATSKSRALLTCFPDLLDTTWTHTITPGSKLVFSYIAGTLPGLENCTDQTAAVPSWFWVVTHVGWMKEDPFQDASSRGPPGLDLSNSSRGMSERLLTQPISLKLVHQEYYSLHWAASLPFWISWLKLQAVQTAEGLEVNISPVKNPLHIYLVLSNKWRMAFLTKNDLCVYSAKRSQLEPPPLPKATTLRRIPIWGFVCSRFSMRGCSPASVHWNCVHYPLSLTVLYS